MFVHVLFMSWPHFYWQKITDSLGCSAGILAKYLEIVSMLLDSNRVRSLGQIPSLLVPLCSCNLRTIVDTNPVSNRSILRAVFEIRAQHRIESQYCKVAQATYMFNIRPVALKVIPRVSLHCCVAPP